MGWVIIPVLEENKGFKDEEIKMRIGNLLDNLRGRKYEMKKDVIEGEMSVKFRNNFRAMKS